MRKIINFLEKNKVENLHILKEKIANKKRVKQAS